MLCKTRWSRGAGCLSLSALVCPTHWSQQIPLLSSIFPRRRATSLLPDSLAPRLGLFHARAMGKALAGVGLLGADRSQGAGWTSRGSWGGRQGWSQHAPWAGGLIPGQPEAGGLADGLCPCSRGWTGSSPRLEVIWPGQRRADPEQCPTSLSGPCLLAQRPPVDVPSCRCGCRQGTAW